MLSLSDGTDDADELLEDEDDESLRFLRRRDDVLERTGDSFTGDPGFDEGDFFTGLSFCGDFEVSFVGDFGGLSFLSEVGLSGLLLSFGGETSLDLSFVGGFVFIGDWGASLTGEEALTGGVFFLAPPIGASGVSLTTLPFLS